MLHIKFINAMINIFELENQKAQQAHIIHKITFKISTSGFEPISVK